MSLPHLQAEFFKDKGLAHRLMILSLLITMVQKIIKHPTSSIFDKITINRSTTIFLHDLVAKEVVQET